MALVNYGSSDEGTSDEEMDTDEQVVTIVPKSATNKSFTLPSSDGIKKSNETFINLPSTYLKFDILPEPQESSLPPPVSSLNFPEEIGPIPPKKVYDENEIEKPPGKNDNNNIKIIASSSSFASSLTAQKTSRGVMRISAPSLKDLMDDDEDDVDKKPKSRVIQPSKKGSGLFAILPEPKQTSLYQDPFKKTSTTTETSRNVKINKEPSPSLSSSAPSTSASSSSSSYIEPSTNPSPVVPTSSKSLIPHAVQQALLGKRPIPTKLDEIKSKYLKQEANVRIVSKGNKKKHDSDDSDEESSSDFFSFASASEVIPEDPSLRIPEYVVPSLPQPSQVDTVPMEESYENPTRQQQADIDIMPYIPKGKKSKGEKINFIEVKADDLKPEPQEWLKQVSAEAPVQRRQKDGPGGMQKRKHQITYLAFQAKEREQELKNEWSQNKMTKRATQSKYGF